MTRAIVEQRREPMSSRTEVGQAVDIGGGELELQLTNPHVDPRSRLIVEAGPRAAVAALIELQAAHVTISDDPCESCGGLVQCDGEHGPDPEGGRMWWTCCACCPGGPSGTLIELPRWAREMIAAALGSP